MGCDACNTGNVHGVFRCGIVATDRLNCWINHIVPTSVRTIAVARTKLVLPVKEKMANNEETTSYLLPSSSSSSHNTCVLACGFRHIFIPKSGNRFPAWLVQIGVPENGQHTGSTAQTTTTSAVWRSKRDFLRLSRCTSTASSGRIVFPKRALTKLADAAPWKRPNDPTGRDSLNATHALAGHEGEDNHWKVSMKKNLFVLDRFLQQTAEYCQKEQETNTATQYAKHEAKRATK